MMNFSIPIPFDLWEEETQCCQTEHCHVLVQNLGSGQMPLGGTGGPGRLHGKHRQKSEQKGRFGWAWKQAVNGGLDSRPRGVNL